jgi:hypothetical protein
MKAMHFWLAAHHSISSLFNFRSLIATSDSEASLSCSQ